MDDDSHDQMGKEIHPWQELIEFFTQLSWNS